MPNVRRKAADKSALTVTVEVTNFTFDVEREQYTATYQIRFGNRQFSQGGGFQFVAKRPADYAADQPLPPSIVVIPVDLNLAGAELAGWMEDQIIARMSADGASA
jgi:hypothetical protein